MGTLAPGPARGGGRANIVVFPQFPGAAGLAAAPSHKIRIMDIERINAIGNNLADLSERTAALRGYL